MARDPRHDILFESLQVGPKTLRNRFYHVPQCSGFGVEKPSSQAAHRAIKAEGGWASVCTEIAPISRESDPEPYVGSTLWDDDDVRSLSLVCEQVHKHGALAAIELHHGGVNVPNRGSRLPTIGPSQIGSRTNILTIPKTADRADLKRLPLEWAAAARRAIQAGFDLVYLLGSFGTLLAQFLSPFYNARTDEYGGSLENRARLWLEALAAVREAADGQCAVAARISFDTQGSEVLPIEESLEFVRMADDLVDLWDVNLATAGRWDRDSGSSRFFEENYQIPFTGRIREATNKPVVGVGRLTNPDIMAEIIRSGTWDLIGAARPSIADPFLPRKIEEGRYDEIRECIGCNICIAKSDLAGRHIGCTQNATAGEEYRRGWHPELFEPAHDRDLDVLVVGAGPAGMECAIVLAKRGIRRVHLVEAEQEPGGCMRWIPRLPGLSAWGRVVDWRTIQLSKLKSVEIIMEKRLTSQECLEYGADMVVIATGSHWATDGLNRFTRASLPGADVALDHILTPEQIMLGGKRPPDDEVVVYDTDGYFIGPAIANLLAIEGFAVRYLTPFEVIAPVAAETLEQDLTRTSLRAAGVAIETGITLQSLIPTPRGVDLDEEPVELPETSIVLVTQRLSNESLYLDLVSDPERLERELIRRVVRIGDCVAPRLLAEAIFDGHRVGRDLEYAHDPSLEYHREHPFAYARAHLERIATP